MKRFSANGYYLISILLFHSLNILFQIFFVDTLMIGYDSGFILNASRSIMQGDGYTGAGKDFWPPLFSLIIIIGFKITSDWFLAGKLISFISSIIFLIFSFKILKILWDESIALFSVLFLVISPTIALYSTIVANQMIFSALISIGLYLFLRYLNLEDNSEKGTLFLIFSGIFLGLAALTRYTGYIIFLSILTILIFNTLRKERKIDLLRNFGKFVSPFIITQIPWYLINFIEHNILLKEKNYLNFALYYSKTEENLFWSIYSYEYSSYLDVFIKQSFSEHISHFVYNLMILFSNIIYLLPLIILGLVFLPKISQFNKTSTAFSLIIILPFIFFHLISLTKIRFFIPIFPLLLGLLFINIKYLIKVLSNKNKFKKIRTVFLRNPDLLYVLLVMSILIIPIIQPKNFHNMVSIYHTERNLDNEIDPIFIAEVLINSSFNEVIMTIHPTYGYYTGLSFLGLETIPHLTLEERLQSKTLDSLYYRYLKYEDNSKKEVPIPTYLVIDLLVVKELPELDYLFYETGEIPDFLIKIIRNEKVILYKILGLKTG